MGSLLFVRFALQPLLVILLLMVVPLVLAGLTITITITITAINVPVTIAIPPASQVAHVPAKALGSS